VLLVLITLLGAALRFFRIGHQGFWYDESYTVLLSKLSLGRMLGLLPREESTPPVYYCVVWVWTRIFGFGQAGVRSLSAVLGTAAIPLAYATARKLLPGQRTALIVAALTAFNPMLIWYSQEARSYETLLFVSELTLLAFAYARERPRPLALTLWALSAALALGTHYYASLIVIPEAVVLVYEHRYKRSVYVALGFVGVVGAALLPLLVSQSGTGNSNWIANAPFLKRAAQVLPFFLIGPETPLRIVLKFIAFAVALAALGLLFWCSRRRERQGALLPAGLLIGGCLISVLVIPITDTFLARNLMALWLPLALVLASGMGVLRARVFGATLAAALCAIGVIATVGVATDYKLERPNWQRLALALGAWPSPHANGGSGRIIVIQANPELPPLNLYENLRLKYMKGNETGITQVDIVAVRDMHTDGGFCWWGSMCNLVPSRSRKHYRLRGFHLVRRLRVEQFDVAVFTAQTPQTVRLHALERTIVHHRGETDTLAIER